MLPLSSRLVCLSVCSFCSGYPCKRSNSPVVKYTRIDLTYCFITPRYLRLIEGIAGHDRKQKIIYPHSNENQAMFSLKKQKSLSFICDGIKMHRILHLPQGNYTYRGPMPQNTHCFSPPTIRGILPDLRERTLPRKRATVAEN